MNLHNGSTTSGYLYLVDLAGSERVKLTAASGIRLREAQNINKWVLTVWSTIWNSCEVWPSQLVIDATIRSLSALGDVIAAMASGHKHVPYRNSKLTFLLQDALKESSKVLMFVNINPSPVFTGESTCSLQFATRCRSVIEVDNTHHCLYDFKWSNHANSFGPYCCRSVQLGRPRKNIAYQANGKPK